MRFSSGSVRAKGLLFVFVASILGGASAHSATCGNGEILRLKTYLIGSTESMFAEADPMNKIDRLRFMSTQSLEGMDYSEENGAELQRFFGTVQGRSVAEMTGPQRFDYGKLVRVELGSTKNVSHVEVIDGREIEVSEKIVVLKVFTTKNCGFEVVISDVTEGSEDAMRYKKYYAGFSGLDVSMSMDIEERVPSRYLFPEDLEAEKKRPAILVRNALITMTCASPSKHAFCRVR